MSQQMIADPQALGAQYRLGNHRATYKPPTWHIIILSFVLIHGCIIATFIVLSAGAFALFMLPFVSVVLYMIITKYQNRVLRVFVYDYGFIHVGRQSQQAIYWQNVWAVWHKVEEETSKDGTTYSHTYTVSCTNSTHLKLDATFANVGQLGKSLELATAHLLFPAALNTYQRSQIVNFGPLTVTPQGLYFGSSLLLWTEVKSIKIDEYYGQIVIEKQGKPSRWASVALGDLPNVEVFRMLVQHITGVRL